MKKYIVLALLFVPMVSWGAPSVRVLGSNTATSTAAGSTVRVTPAKNVVSKTSDSTASRVGTLRTKTKANTVSSAGTTTNSRFPVITPAHSYSSVVKPQPTGGGTTTVIQQQDVDLDNYYTKSETYNTNEVDQKLDDPRFDMIRISDGDPRDNWDPAKVKEREDQGYVFMWIEK